MKKVLLGLGCMFAAHIAIGQCNLNIVPQVSPVSCNGNDGKISLQTNVKGLLISEYLANPAGTDSPFEWVELVAVRTVDFSVTPYTVIVNNNGTATANGWVHGANITYAFQIDTGFVRAGDVIYVGGSQMAVSGTIFRSINTGTTGGDGGIGNANQTGVLGNGGANADGIAVFDLPVSAITSTSVPVDAVFFGTGIGSALVGGGSGGYELPVNDHYNGGKLQSNSFFGPEPGNGLHTAAIGTFDIAANNFTVPRVWANTGVASDGISTVTLAGSYTINWSTGDTTDIIENLAPGTYIAIVSASLGCADTDTIVLNAPIPFTILANTSNPSCAGGNDGSVSLTVSGGVPGYTYAWSNGATTPTITGLIAGTYTVTITDTNGCDTITGYTLNDPLPLVITGTTTNSTCQLDNDGGITVVVTGGSGSYTYGWTPNVSSSDVVTNVPSGNYTVIVTDLGGCSDTASFTVGFDFAAPGLNLGPDQTLCAPDSTVLDAGAGFSSYTWSNGQTTQTIVVSVSGTYSVEIEDANGCTNVDSVVVIIQPCTGLENQEFSFAVMPNPATEYITVTSNFTGNLNISLTDMQGRIVRKQVTAANQPIYIQSLEAGIYILAVEMNGQVFTSRLVKK